MGIFKKKDKTEATEEQIAKAKKSKKRRIKAIVICVIVIIYTAVVSFITVKVDRKILSDSLEKSFKEVFSSEPSAEDEASSENTKNDKKENSSSKKENSKDNASNKDNTSNKNTSDKNSSSSDKKENLPVEDDVIIEDSNEPSAPTKVNDMFMLEHVCEVEILGADFTKKVTSPSGLASHNSFESKKQGYQYLDFKMNYQNLEKALVNIEQITSVRIIVGDTDYYESFSLIEDKTGNLTYTSTAPISSGKIGKLHFLFNVPDSVATGSSRIVAVITIRGNTYEYVIR